jgi:hypothetical protein
MVDVQTFLRSAALAFVTSLPEFFLPDFLPVLGFQIFPIGLLSPGDPLPPEQNPDERQRQEHDQVWQVYRRNRAAIH